MRELSDCELIIPSRNSRLKEIRSWLGTDAAELKVAARFANVVTAYELCRNGVGIAIYPAAAADIVKDSDSVRIRTISDPGIRASYVLIYSSEHPLHTLARRFVDHILSQPVKPEDQ